MKLNNLRNLKNTISTAVLLSFCGFVMAQSSTLTRATELRSDKLGSASVVSELAVGSSVQVVSLEGGWAQVQAAGKSGWVRASSLALNAGASSASSMSAGRDAKGNVARAASHIEDLLALEQRVHDDGPFLEGDAHEPRSESRRRLAGRR